MTDTPTVTGDPRTDTGVGYYCLRYILYLDKTNQALLEWMKWAEKRIPQDSVFNGEITVGTASQNSTGDYWMSYHGLLPHFGPVTLMLSHQQRGQGTSERLHQAEKRISTKTRDVRDV